MACIYLGMCYYGLQQEKEIFEVSVITIITEHQQRMKRRKIIEQTGTHRKTNSKAYLIFLIAISIISISVDNLEYIYKIGCYWKDIKRLLIDSISTDKTVGQNIAILS